MYARFQSGMLSPQRIRELLDEPELSDEEAAAIRDHLRALAELAIDKRLLDRTGQPSRNSRHPSEGS